MSAALNLVPQSFPDAESFHAELKKLEDLFASMQPQYELVVRDSSLGVEGYVVVWNTDISKYGPVEGCGKGGTRIMPHVTLDEVKMLARTMALKNAAAGLPLGGAKSGLRADPNTPDFEKKYRRFVRLCAPVLYENGGPYGGFGFDLGGRSEHALWACDELKSERCFTGKPLERGGTGSDREGISGLGVAVAGQTMLEIKGKKAAKSTFAIQGMGLMGTAVFRYFSETGARLSALSDPKYGGTWLFKKHPSAKLSKALLAQDEKQVVKLLEAEAHFLSEDPEQVLFTQTDILFPCAVQNVLTETNSAKVNARFICEGAHSPCTDEARTRLHELGVSLVPDFIANAGGVIAAYVEMVSSSDQKADEAKDMTRAKISENVKALYDLVDCYGCEPYHAGMYMALSKILTTP